MSFESYYCNSSIYSLAICLTLYSELVLSSLIDLIPIKKSYFFFITQLNYKKEKKTLPNVTRI